MDAPGAVYNTSIAPIKPKILAAKMLPESKHDKEKYKVKKSELPAPGTYDIDKPSKLVKVRILEAQFSKKPHKSFIEEAKKHKEFVPGVGHYKELDKAFKRISSNPPSIRTKRH